MSNKVYDILKWIAQILLPAIGTLYFGIARIWDLPLPEEVVGTITVIDTFLGCILGISTMSYNEQKRLELEEARKVNAQDTKEDNTL